MKTVILTENNTTEILNKTLKVLVEGGLVVFPSDTVYGLLCDATDGEAVKKLIQFKNRPPGKAISVFCNFTFFRDLVEITEKQEDVIRQVLPGPFTVVLPSRHKVDRLLESEKNTLGIRIPKYELINQLIQKFKKPVTATSANLANRPPHYSVKTLLDELSEKQKQMIDLVVDAGQLPRNKPSTVIDLTQPNVKILRQGDVNFSDLKYFQSKTAEETKEIAKQIYEDVIGTRTGFLNNKPLIFIIEGEMGVGKTVFVKGIGESLGIQNIISPTFVIYYEYGNFYHFDLYQIENEDEFKDLKINNLLKPNNILCFEWGEKAGEIIDLLKNKGNIIYIKMKYLDEKTREIAVKSQIISSK